MLNTATGDGIKNLIYKYDLDMRIAEYKLLTINSTIYRFARHSFVGATIITAAYNFIAKANLPMLKVISLCIAACWFAYTFQRMSEYLISKRTRYFKARLIDVLLGDYDMYENMSSDEIENFKQEILEYIKWENGYNQAKRNSKSKR